MTKELKRIAEAKPRFDVSKVFSVAKPRANTQAELDRVLKDYQLENVQAVLDKGRLLIADSMGLGKTAVAVVATVRSGQLPAIVVAPKNTHDGWLKQVVEFYPRLPGPNPIAAIAGPDIAAADFKIVSPEDLVKYEPDLRAFKVKTVIFDESHIFKNWMSKRSMAAARLVGRQVKLRILLSGTPIKNRRPDLLHQLEMLDADIEVIRHHPNFLKAMAAAHKRGKCELSRQTKQALLLSMDRVHLNNVLETYIMKRHSAEVERVIGVPFARKVLEVDPWHPIMGNLPKLVTLLQKLKLTPLIPKSNFPALNLPPLPDDEHQKGESRADKQRRHDKQLAWYRQLVAPRVKESSVAWPAQRQHDAYTKILFIMAWALRCYQEKRKVIFFTHHVGVADFLAEYLPGVVLLFHGSSKLSMVEVKEQAAEANFIVATMDSMATGVDALQDTFHEVAFVELSYVHTTHEQAEGRVRRPGQKKPVVANYFVLRGSTDDRVMEALNDKWADNSRVMEGKRGSDVFVGQAVPMSTEQSMEWIEETLMTLMEDLLTWVPEYLEERQ